MSLGEHWLVYHGKKAGANPLLSVKKHVNFLQSKALAHVTRCSSADAERCTYQVEGSYSQRCCGVYDERRQLAEIKRKEAVGGVGFGGDVIWLIVQPGMEAAVAMAVVSRAWRPP